MGLEVAGTETLVSLFVVVLSILSIAKIIP